MELVSEEVHPEGNNSLIMQGEAEETDEETDVPDASEESMEGFRSNSISTTESLTSDIGEHSDEIAAKNVDVNKAKSFMYWKFKSINLALKRDIIQHHSKCCTDAAVKMNKVCERLDLCQKSAVEASGNIRKSMNNVQKSTKRMDELYQFADEALPKIVFTS